VLTKHSLSFNIPNIDDLFQGFTEGDFAAFYGTSHVLSLSLLLAVRAQLPFQLGGLETNVVFVDGGNSFRLYEVSRIAQLHQLDPRQVLERIFVSRAFTAYQLTSLILEKLEETVERFSSKLVIISVMTELFLDKDVPRREALEVFNQLTLHLSKFAREKQVIVMATCSPQYDSRRNILFRVALCGRANVVLSVRQSKHERQLILEKHPVYELGYAGFPSEHLPLDQYLEAWIVGKTVESYRVALDMEIQEWRGFAKALRTDDREAFEQLLDACRNYASAGGNATRPVLFEAMAMSILVYQQKRLTKLENELNALRQRSRQP
jgi:hypothetical protein